MSSNILTTLYVIRRKLKLTQNELALAVGVNQADISLLENGWTPNPKMEILGKLAEILEFPDDPRDLLMEYQEYLLKKNDIHEKEPAVV